MLRASSLVTEGLTDTLVRRRLWEWTGASLTLVAAVALTCLALGVLIAWLLTVADVPGRRWLVAANAVPLAVPSFVSAFGWLDRFPSLQGFWPTWAILSAACLPYVVLPTMAALRLADHALVDVARSMGQRPWRAFASGMLPQIAPAALAGALLAGLYALSDFGTPGLMRHEVLTFAVYRQYGSMIGRERAALLALALVAVALTLVVLERVVRGDSRRWSVARGALRTPPVSRLGAWRWPAVGILLLPVVVAAVVPCAALLHRLSLGTRHPLSLAELLTAVVTTLTVSLLGGLVALTLAGFVGVLAARFPGPRTTVVESLSFAGHALPGIAVGLSLVFLSLKVFPSLYQTLPVLLLAYAVLFLPKAVGSVRTSVAAVPPVLAEVATTLGRSRLQAQLVTARLAAPGISAGFLLVVVTAMKELPATLILRPSGLDTLATEIWTRTSSSAQGAAAPYALALVLVASIPALALSRTSTWERR